MNKKLSIVVALMLGASLVGCGQKATAPVKPNVANTQSTEVKTTSDTTVASEFTEQSVKDAIITLSKFKGDASPNNVKDLYSKLKDMLSPEEQDIYEKDNVPNCTNPSHYKTSNITKIVAVADMPYDGKQYNGYNVAYTYSFTNDGDGKLVSRNSETDIINYKGKLLVIGDKLTSNTNNTGATTTKADSDKQVVLKMIVYTATDISVKIFGDLKANETYYVRLEDLGADKVTKPQAITPIAEPSGQLALNVKFHNTEIAADCSFIQPAFSIQLLDANSKPYHVYPIDPPR